MLEKEEGFLSPNSISIQIYSKYYCFRSIINIFLASEDMQYFGVIY